MKKSNPLTSRSNPLTLFVIGMSIAFGLSARADFFGWPTTWIEDQGSTREHPAVKEAMASSSIQNDRDYTLHTDAKQLCTANPPSYTDSSVNYWISRKESGIVIDLPIMVKYRGTEESREKVSQRIPEVEKCVEDFYHKNGITLNLTLTEGDPSSAKAYGYSFVRIWDNYGRDNSANWAVLQDQNGYLSVKQACSLWAHEVGHLLGLPDRYADPSCPDRPGLENSQADRNDIMAKTGADPYEQTLSDDDVAIILKPLLNN